MIDPFLTLFQKIVPSIFGFLEEFDYLLTQEEVGRFVASSPSCRVVLEYEKHHFASWIEPNIFGDGETVYPALNVELIAICKGYRAREFSDDLSEMDVLKREISNCAEYLKTYCLPYLKGDFTDWNSIGDCIYQRMRQSDWQKVVDWLAKRFTE